MDPSDRTLTVFLFTPQPEDLRYYREQLQARYPHLEVTGACTPQAASPLLPLADVLLVWRMPPALYPLAARARWIQALGTGMDEVLAGWRSLVARHPEKQAIPITNLHAALPHRIAEYVIGFTLALTLGIPTLLRQQAEHRWHRLIPGRLEGKTVGIAGYGRVGARVGELMHALGARVVGWKRTSTAPGPLPEGVRLLAGPEGLSQLLPDADVLVITLPHTPATQGLIGAREIGAMKQGALLINVGRGGIVDEAALSHALHAGHLGGAVLDVFSTEPLPPDSPLWDAPNLLVTPHMAGPTVAAESLPEILDNLNRFLQGLPLRNRVDPEAGY